MPLVQCLIPPDSCHTDGYYREPVPQEILAPLNQALNLSLPNVYLETGYTSGGSLYPFYSVQVADGAAVYRQLEQLSRMAKVEASVLRNPSLPLDEITAAFNASDALLVLCPRDAGDPTLDAAVAALHAHLLTLITWPGDHGKVLKSFRSQAELDRYVADASYGDEGHPKVGAAVVVNQAEVASARWDYAIRLNFTQGFEQDSVAVGALECVSRPLLHASPYRLIHERLSPPLHTYPPFIQAAPTRAARDPTICRPRASR